MGLVSKLSDLAELESAGLPPGFGCPTDWLLPWNRDAHFWPGVHCTW